jgi:hypothetical protein
MRLTPIGQDDRSWAKVKTEWKAAADKAGEDFSTLTTGALVFLEPLSLLEGPKSGLYAYSEADEVRAVCQIGRILVSRYPSPVVRVRFITVSPLFDAGTLDVTAYAQLMVSLFSGVVWLARTSLGARIIQFHLRSPSDAQYFTALQIAAPLSPFSKFSIKGSWIECLLKDQIAVNASGTV